MYSIVNAHLDRNSYDFFINQIYTLFDICILVSQLGLPQGTRR